MRFVLTDEFWALDALTPAEWHLVAELPAASDCDVFSPATRERLFPSLFSPDTLIDEDTQSHLEDWDRSAKLAVMVAPVPMKSWGAVPVLSPTLVQVDRSVETSM